MLSLGLAVWLAAAKPFLRCQRIDLPNLTVMDGCDKLERSASFARCTLEDPAITKVVNAMVESRVRERAEYDAKAAEPPGEHCQSIHTISNEVWCGEAYRLKSILSYDCTASWTGGAHPDGTPWSIVLDIDVTARDRVREMKVHDLFIDAGAEQRFWDLVRADIRHELEEGDAAAEDIAAADRHFAAFRLTADGVTISYARWAFHGDIDNVTIPHASLRGILAPRFLP
jgi:hypothetical protein